jgi:2-polyprenyl-3-methyl-5-hydroxy-6-metoxy-1,4-benzoquinol methylase
MNYYMAKNSFHEDKSVYKRYQKSRIVQWDEVAQKIDTRHSFGWYYHKRLEQVLQFVIPPGQRVIELGCSNHAADDPEKIWGWKTPAGKHRAQRRANLIASSVSLSPDKYVLEIGCGTGVFTEMFAQTGARIVAVDISADLLEVAQAKNLPPTQVQFLEKRFEDCEQIGPFDAIIGSSVLHHLDIKPALATIYKLLKPNGKFSFTEPNMLNPQIVLQKNVAWIKRKMGDSPDETAFLRGDLRHLLCLAGLVDVQIMPFDWLHPATPVKLIDTVDKIGSILEKIPIIREFAGSLHIYGRRPK